MSESIQVAGYRILGSIGQGGMGQLFQAEREDSRQVVAIKVIHHHLSSDPQIVKRFEREANTLSKLNHPSIVRIIERGKTEKGRLYLVTEFVDGHTLRYWISDKRLSVGQVVEVIRLVGESLQYAHSQNVLHRDIKPENILLLRHENGQLSVKVLDFGLAAAVERSADEPELTAAGAVIGTPFYMSPEQRFDPRKVDARTDIYALGVLFYELLSGTPPRGAYRLPSEHNPFAAPALDAIIEKMMATGPQYRYQSATEVLEALAKVCATGITRTAEEAEAARAKQVSTSAGGSKRLARPASTPQSPVATPPPAASSSASVRPAPRPVSQVSGRPNTSPGVDPSVPTFSALPASCLQPTLTVGGRCRAGAKVNVRVGSKLYQTVAGAQGHFSVMVDVHEGDNVLVAWSEMDGVRSPDSPLHHVRFTPGGTRVSTGKPGAEEQRYGTIVHSGTPPPAPAAAKHDPNWNPSTPNVYGVTDPPSAPFQPEPEPAESPGSKWVFFLVLLVLGAAAVAGVLALTKPR